MKKRYFLGAGAGYKVSAFRQLFVHGIEADCRALSSYLVRRYQGSEAILTKNGRSALCLALKANFQKGDGVIVNGFTCYAVVEAVLAAGMVPVYADISAETLNFTAETLEQAARQGCKGIIVQNTLGNPVDIAAVERFAKRHGLTIIEDLAHCAGVLYPDGREAGTVGAAVALSFGKEKMVDTVSGGAVVFKGEAFARTEGVRSAAARGVAREPRGDGRERRAPRFGESSPRVADYLRARWYPMFMAVYRGLMRVRLAGPFMRCLLRLHFVERSADNRLDLGRKICKFEARLALEQMKNLKKSGEKPLRTFVLVENRDEVLKKLRAAGYYFGGFWYEKPVSPERYYKKVHFPEAECPVATEVAAKIINFPTYYSAKEMAEAMRIVRETGVTGAKKARSKVPAEGDKTKNGARTEVPKEANGARSKVPKTGVKKLGARRVIQ